MYLKKVKIENFRAISNLELHFKNGVNLLIGDNGAGKTSILEALSVGLAGYLIGITGVSIRGIQQTDVRMTTSKLADASSAISYNTPVAIECDANIGGVHFNWIRTRQDQSSESRTRIENREIVHYAKGISNIVESTLPLLRYFGTSRISQPKREDSGSSLKKKLNDRRCGYIGCLDDALDDKAIRAWCLKMEMEAFHRNTQIQEYENFKKLVSSIMKSMSELDYYPEVFYSRQLEDIVYSDGEQVLPISFLSAGYQSILWISMDIAYRMAIMNPHHNSHHEIPGIVMIDELDMHLHPKWQWNAIRALEENFPNIQFIIATHSPILISSCKNEHLIHIDDNHHVDYPQAAYAYSIEDVVEFVQGSTGIPYEIRDLKTSFDDALNSNDIVLAREIVQDMIAKFGCDNSEVKIALAELDVEDSLSED